MNRADYTPAQLDAWADGHIDIAAWDRLFTAHYTLVAAALCDRLEAAVNAFVIVTHASVTAKPFFEQRGYVTVREQQVMKKGVLLTNFVMEKNKER